MQPLWKTVWRFLKKLEIELPYDLMILFLGIFPKDPKTGYIRDTCKWMFIATLFTISKLWKQSLLGALQLMNGSRNCGIYTPWSITQS
jgi:hypothetical protein